MNPKQKYYENIANTILNNFKKRQIEGYYCKDKEEALKKALELIPEGSSVGWGGSMTLNEIGLLETIKKGNYHAIDRENFNTKEEERKLYGEICCSDFFLMSSNAITIEGELVNIDARGNRVSFLCYGPTNVLVIVGMNKVSTDIDSAFKRVKNIASPANVIRLNHKTPCAITGKCENCFSPDCICSQYVVTRRSNIKNRIKVILVGEELGY